MLIGLRSLVIWIATLITFGQASKKKCLRWDNLVYFRFTLFSIDEECMLWISGKMFEDFEVFKENNGKLKFLYLQSRQISHISIMDVPFVFLSWIKIWLNFLPRFRINTYLWYIIHMTDISTKKMWVKKLDFLGSKVWPRINCNIRNVETMPSFMHALKKNILLHLQSYAKLSHDFIICH